jgi:hypothetical protein
VEIDGGVDLDNTQVITGAVVDRRAIDRRSRECAGSSVLRYEWRVALYSTSLFPSFFLL